MWPMPKMVSWYVQDSRTIYSDCKFNVVYHFVYRITCTRKEIFSSGLNFLSKLNAHPHDCWIGIINRMNLDVFQYKLLVIPSNQDNHKSLFVVIGLQNVVKHGRRLGNGDHPCILHLKSGKRQLNHSLTNVTAPNIRLLLNKLYKSCQSRKWYYHQSIQFKIDAT